jgi:hypothetical protein
MKHLCYLLLLFGFVLSANAQSQHKSPVFRPAEQANRSGAFLYSLSVTTDDYTDLTNPIDVNNGEIWDDPEYTVPIGFPFTLNGHDLTHLSFFGFGFLLAAPTSNPDIQVGVFPFEADLIDRGALEEIESLSPIGYQLEGAPGSRIFKLEIKNAGSYYELADNDESTMFINLQLWLYEGSNKVEFRYGPMSIGDEAVFYGGETGAYIGITDIDGNSGEVTEAHFLSGNAFKPALSDQLVAVNGTPPPGFVYIMSLPSEPLELDLSSENSTSFCDPNGTATATVTGGLEPYTYAWSNGGTTATITGLDEGTYTVTVTDDEGSAISGSISIASPDALGIVILTTDESGTGAEDGSATALVDGGTAPYGYEWSNGETTSTITDLAPGVYTLTVTDEAGCIATGTAIINAFGCPELEFEFALNNMACFGNCDGSVTIVQVLNGSAPYTYEWSNGESGAGIDELCAGEYFVTIIDNAGCFTTGAFTITEPTQLVANAGATPETVVGANDGTAFAATFGGVPPYNFLWSNGETTQMIIGLAPGEYSVIVTDQNGCVANDTVAVEAGACGLLTGTVTDASCPDICDGSITLDVDAWTAFSWSDGSNTPVLTNLCAGVYSVTATDAAGCSVVETFVVNEPDPVLLNAGSTAETIAGGDGTAWVTPTGGTPPYLYQWENGSTDSLITGLSAGLYSVTVVDALGCSAADVVIVGEFVCFTIDLNEVMHVGCHDGCDGLIFVVPVGGVGPFEYSWSNGDTTNAVFDLCAGLYGVTITDVGQGCSGSVEVEITQPDSFYFTVEQIVPFSDTSAGSIDVTFHGGTAPYFPVWFGPDFFLSFNEDISDLEPGEYILSLFDSHDCEVVDTLVVLDLTVGLPVLPEGAVSIYPNPATSFIHIAANSTDAYSVELISPLGAKINTWQNATAIEVSALAAGVYMVRFVNRDGYYVERILVQ